MTAAVKQKTIRERISDLVTEAYLEHELNIIPIYPNVLVKLLPRSLKSSGGIILPEKQNKILIEAVVLATYKPRWRRGFAKAEIADVLYSDSYPDQVAVDKTWVQSEVDVGDHIMFRHHLGAPVQWLDGGTGEYRLVNENEMECTLEYGQADDAIRQLVDEYGLDRHADPKSIAENYYVIRKDLRSRTTSGA